jgi:thiamine transport system ATP-binding protein
MGGAELELVGIDVTFDGTPVLRGTDLTVGAGEVVALLGPSGTGKSTLLRVIAGLVAPDRGSVRIDGFDVTRTPTHRRGVGMVFQDNQLFPHRSTLDNVAFGLKMAGVGRAERHARAAAWLDRVGLGGFGSRTVTELSGGEAKRVALARTLVTEPAIVLLDEPLSGLDRELHDQLVAELATLLRDSDTTALLVTHDLDEAASVADRTVRLDEIQAFRAVEIAAIDTASLRRRVLRDGDPDAVLDWPGDHDPDTFHLGIRDRTGAVVAISTWLSTSAGTQLRGMATEPGLAGTGLGSHLLAAGVRRCRARGDTAVWANARETALGFYARAGFTAVGTPFVTPDTGLPHRRVELDLTSAFPFGDPTTP